jgi:hypothetical protein
MSYLTSSPPRHPWTLWTFCLIILLIGGYNMLLAFDHLSHADVYRDLGVSYPPLLRAGLALGWGAALLGIGGGLARRRRWARRWILIVLSNYSAFNVLWMIVYTESGYSRERVPFVAITLAGLVLVAAWIMRWRRVRRAFDNTPTP